MKKLICIITSALIMSFAFTGCGEGKDKLASDASDMGSDIVSEVETMASDMMSDGTVTDDDGIIGNEGNNSNSNNDDMNATDNNNSSSAE